MNLFLECEFVKSAKAVECARVRKSSLFTDYDHDRLSGPDPSAMGDSICILHRCLANIAVTRIALSLPSIGMIDCSWSDATRNERTGNQVTRERVKNTGEK